MKRLSVIILGICFLCSCKKYLAVKPDKSLVIPNSLENLYGLLDYTQIMNRFNQGLGEASADNYYLTYEDWKALNNADQNTYIWGDEIAYDVVNNEWQTIYTAVYYANVILDNLKEIPRTDQNLTDRQNLTGAALFFRSRALLIALMNWAKSYDSLTARDDLGIPLRLNADFNTPSTRSSVQKCYDQMIDDVKSAAALLPAHADNAMRPSKVAAYALLSRIYLAMRAYHQSLLYADSALTLYHALMDFNDLDASVSYPIPQLNAEVIFHSSGFATNLKNSIAKIDSNLMATYPENDLRRSLFFSQNPDSSFAYRGSYFGSSIPFNGIATDELYLNKAECLIRAGNIDEGIVTLNTLLAKRWKKGTFEELTASGRSEALAIVLRERRKELVMRNLRWMDLKRLNMETENHTTIRRRLGKEVYELKPNDPRYALPIPRNIINLTGMPQNDRK